MNKEAQRKKAELKIREIAKTADIKKVAQAVRDTYSEYIKSTEKEDCFSAKILPVNNITLDSPDVGADEDDNLYVTKRIEPTQKALSVGARGMQTARFVQGKKLRITPEKFESEKIKITQDQLRILPNLFSMLKVKGKEAIDRQQDKVFARTATIGSYLIGNTLGVDASNPSIPKVTASSAMDWATNRTTVKTDIVALKRKITRHELKLDKATFLMSQDLFDFFNTLPASEIGDLSGDFFVNGVKVNKQLQSIPVITTVKSSLKAEDVETADADERNLMSYVDGSGHEYYKMYLFGDPEFIGELVKDGGDKVFQKTEEEEIELVIKRKVKPGIADARAIATMWVKIS